ncbi:MAG: AzlC family ABC transporter permease, partial [Clostridia bacterium]|nr:AzlC family ABC transporter permease [Clostridia bacterium]
MTHHQNSGALTFRQGLRDGIPICLGYISVSFAFGVFATAYGVSIWESILLSLTNVTSAGQLAAVPIIAASGSFLELAASQFVINLRYMLMSTSLSQKMDKKM